MIVFWRERMSNFKFKSLLGPIKIEFCLNIAKTKGANQRFNQKGFTIVEVSTALVFVAFIIAFLTATLLNVMSIYNKGIWLSQVNQAGRQLNADLGDQARYSGSNVILREDDQRLCAHGVSYLWNTEESRKNRYQEDRDDSVDGNFNTSLRLVRINDLSGSYCNYEKNKKPYPSRYSNDAVSLLGKGTIIQEFSAKQLNSSNSSTIPLFYLRAVLSTEGEANKPVKVVRDNNNNYTIVSASYDDINAKWQCGEVIDGEFRPAKNQFCAFSEYDITIYQRGEN